MSNSHNVELELVGSILKDGRIYPKIIDVPVTKEMFNNSVARDIFFAASQIHENGMVIDSVTVGDQLQRNGVLDNLKHDAHFGRAALSSIRELGNPKNAESYAITVQDYHGKRWLEEFAPKVAYWAKNGRRAVDIISDAREEFDKINLVVGMVGTNTVDAKEAASRQYDETEKASRGEIKFAKLGFRKLDTWFNMRAGNLCLIAGRPGDGKTAMLVTVALKNAFEGRKVVLFSLEMTTEEITARFLSQMSQVPATRILDGKMDAAEWQAYHTAIERFEKLPIIINDTPSLKISQFRQEARRNIRIGEDALIIVDYVQLMRSGQNKHNRVDEVGEISRALKEISKLLKAPVFAAAQMSRDVEKRANKKPILADLRESGSLEQDADKVIFLWNESEMPDSIFRKLIVAKQRNGAIGEEELGFDGPTMRFTDTAPLT
jgi:replicative DNA helicase